MSESPRIVGIFLVDPRGRVLLQERDEQAPVSPGQWGIVGGHVDPGEDWEPARDRELLEETGLVLGPGTLEQWYAGNVDHDELSMSHDWRLWVGPVALTDADIVCGEGRQIVFVDPSDFVSLDLGESLRHFLPLLLDSQAYARARRTAGQWA